MDADRCVDLFRLRTAVAALYWARHQCRNLDHPAAVARVGAAVDHLNAVHGQFRGELAAACRALLGPGADPDGRRRTRAIDRLAELAHVDDDSATALATLADDQTRSSRPRTLFDPDPGIGTSDD